MESSAPSAAVGARGSGGTGAALAHGCLLLGAPSCSLSPFSEAVSSARRDSGPALPVHGAEEMVLPSMRRPIPLPLVLMRRAYEHRSAVSSGVTRTLRRASLVPMLPVGAGRQ